LINQILGDDLIGYRGVQ